MIRRLAAALAGLLLLSGASSGQTFAPGQVLTADALNAALAARITASRIGQANGVAGLDGQASASALTVLPGSGTVPGTLAALLAEQGHTPDWYRLSTDGADDAPSVQRAVNAACAAGGGTVRFRARHYTMASPVTQSCRVTWQGQGWEEPNYGTTSTQDNAMRGTWLRFQGGAFGTAGMSSPVTILGPAAGSRVQGIAVTQPVTLPAVGDATWTPGDTPALFLIENVNSGVTFEDILCRGVNRCIRTHIANRVVLNRIYGQAWRALMEMDKSYDASRLDEIHAWPFLSVDARILAFTQANAVGLLTRRSDTPLIGRMFVFGVRAGLLVDASATESGGSLPGGTTTGASIAALSCDFVLHCIEVASGALDVTAQVGHLRSYSQQWRADSTVAMLAGSSVINLAGSAILQVGAVESFGTDTAVFRYPHSSAASSLQVGSLVVRTARMSAGSVLAAMATTSGAPHAFGVALAPILPEALPSGWASLTTGSNGAVSWPGVTLPEPAWSSQAVTVTSGSGTLTSVAGTVRYRRVGRTLHFVARVAITTAGTAAGWLNVPLPTGMAAAADAAGGGRELTAGMGVSWSIAPAGSTLRLTRYDNAYLGANGSVLVVAGTIELSN